MYPNEALNEVLAPAYEPSRRMRVLGADVRNPNGTPRADMCPVVFSAGPVSSTKSNW